MLLSSHICKSSMSSFLNTSSSYEKANAVFPSIAIELPKISSEELK